ncbi:MAG TPA: hypothetical protein VJS88_08340 [Chthoniobacterales bacterium]|nr:hypothetical protein [Chthoniobacterales bacterium]
MKTKPFLQALTLIVLTLALGALTSTAHAGQSHFNAAWPTDAPGIWEQDGIWTTSAYPNNGHVIFNSRGEPVPGPDPTYDVLIDVLPACKVSTGINVQAINISKPAVLNLATGGWLTANAGFGNGGEINLAFGSRIYARTGSNGIGLGNAGVITLNAVEGSADKWAILFCGNGSFVNNGGQILMGDSTNNLITGISGGDSFTIAPAGQIRGAGHLSPGCCEFVSLNIVNQGLIEATQSRPLEVHVDATNNTDLRNTGTLRGRGPGTLRISALNGFAGVNNADGIIEAIDNGIVRLEARMTVNGGTLITSGGGTIHGDFPGSNGGVFNDVLNKGTMAVSPDESLSLAGTFTSDGGLVRIDGSPTAFATVLLRGAQVTLAGNGLITVSGLSSIAGADNPGQTMVVTAGMTIRGDGSIGIGAFGNFFRLNLVNSGLIEATTGLTVYVNSSQNSNVANNGGTFRAANGASYLQFNGPGAVVNNDGGVIEALGTSNLLFTGGATLTNNSGGTIDFNGGTLQVDAGLDLNGGTLRGNGTIQGEVRNNGGVFAPGHSPGKITVNGNYTQGGNGVLNMEIGGTAPGTEYDQLIVNGTAVLDGTLNVSLINGFRPAVGDVFQLIVPNAFQGSFNAINTFGFTADANFSNGQITLTVTTVPDIPLNISTRMDVGTDPNQLIGGFVVTGSEPKKLIILATGPSLAAFGLTGVLANPVLELYQGTTLLATNDNWKVPAEAEIRATGFELKNELESALVRTLAPGQYTAVVRGINGTGIGTVQIYDLSETSKSKLANISSRGFVQAVDSRVMIAGFIIGGDGGANSTVVVRALGPSLTGFGIPQLLADPKLELKNANGVTLISNDDWQDSQAAEINAAGFAPIDLQESALITSLSAGHYTAIVRGKDGATGVAVVEVYNVD